jgi:signal transduction histidine kinase
VIARTKAWAKRHWPRLTLRTHLFASFFVVAALPGVGAVALRVYENTLVRQTEAELAAQGAALAASAAALWPAAAAGRTAGMPPRGRPDPHGIPPETDIDLNATPILPPRPLPRTAPPPTSQAQAAAAQLAPILRDTRHATYASIILLDQNGRSVIGTPLRGSYAELPEVASALAGTPRTVLRRNASYHATYRFEWLSRAAALRVHYARPILVGGRVVGVLLLSRSARSLFAGLYEDRGKIAIGVLAILGALILLSGLLSRGIARPIKELRDATRAVAAGRGAVPAIPPTAALEIQDLYQDFGMMADVIDLRARYLRDFAHAVSHEFKTPLSGIRGALELLRDHAETMTPHERQRFLRNADADAERLAALVTRLLELARADMMPATAGDRSDAVAVARKLADALESRTTAIRVRGEQASVFAGVAGSTLETVIATLIDNGIQAGASAITIDVEAGQLVVVTVADNGAGIPPADRQRVFEPFFTSRRAAGGTGLGLAIARSLLSATHGQLDLVAAEEATGTVFQLRLPASGRGSAGDALS